MRARVFAGCAQLKLLALACLLIGLSASCSKEEGIVTSFSVGGACCTCPPERLERYLTRLDNIYEAHYDHRHADLLVRYRPGSYTRDQIKELIQEYGYTVDGEAGVDPRTEACCDLATGMEELMPPGEAEMLETFENRINEEADSIMRELERQAEESMLRPPR